MKLLENIIGGMADFMGRISEWLTFPSIPWGRFTGYWNYLVDLIGPWNKIFPLTDLMVIVGLVLAVSLALGILYTVVLIKSFIPFSGGK